MSDGSQLLKTIRAALQPHGIFVRGVAHFGSDGAGPLLASGLPARSVVLLGNIGGSLWASFAAWRRMQGEKPGHPLDDWSKRVITPVAEQTGGHAFFPSDQPWQPFQQWAMRAEGLKASPLGILIHPDYGLWHGYRGALAFGLPLREDDATAAGHRPHPCDSCRDRLCLSRCPVGAIRPDRFDVLGCRTYLPSPAGAAGCLQTGCQARDACPVGAEYRYPPAQLRFHMAALSR